MPGRRHIRTQRLRRFRRATDWWSVRYLIRPRGGGHMAGGPPATRAFSPGRPHRTPTPSGERRPGQPAWLSRLRDRKVVFAPAVSSPYRGSARWYGCLGGKCPQGLRPSSEIVCQFGRLGGASRSAVARVTGSDVDGHSEIGPTRPIRREALPYADLHALRCSGYACRPGAAPVAPGSSTRSRLPAPGCLHPITYAGSQGPSATRRRCVVPQQVAPAGPGPEWA